MTLIRFVTAGATWTCQLCAELFDSEALLERHLAEYQDERKRIIEALAYIPTHSAQPGRNPSSAGSSSSGDAVASKLNDPRYSVGHQHAIPRCEDDGVGSIAVRNAGVKRKRSKAAGRCSCPQPGCHATRENKTNLRKHFETHVPCLEVHECDKGHSDAQETDVRSRQKTSRRDRLADQSAFKMDDMARQSSYRSQEGSVTAPPFGHYLSHDAWRDASIPQQGCHAPPTQPPYADQSEMNSQYDAIGAVSDEATRLLPSSLLSGGGVAMYNHFSPPTVIQEDTFEYADIFDQVISSSMILPDVPFNQ
ncbi:hypothetical protein PWT90_10771 [Aphanocladium album]|nr:hypothetical protein PWT90_10771 [Aphanocladium album]